MAARTLRRSQTNRGVAGVCGGLGEYFGIDPVIIRFIFILLLLPGGAPGLLPYLLFWLVMPEAT
jgi:phage shock protein C